jgi:hypothetical protein
MAVKLKQGGSPPSATDDEQRRADQRRTREQFGIATLADDEELIDDATFAELHVRLAMAGGDDATPSPDDPSPGDDDDEVDELLLEEVATELPGHSSAGLADSGRPGGPAEIAELERMLPDAKDRDEVADLALRIARYHARATALFVVNRGMIAGLRGSGEGLESRLEGIIVPSDSESLFQMSLETGKAVRSAGPASSIDRRVLRAMGRGESCDVAVLPIAIGDRVVNLLYVDNGDVPLSETSIGALRVLCGGVGKIYQRLILERKRAGGTEQSERRSGERRAADRRTSE